MPEQRLPVKEEVEKIRREVQRNGESCATCDTLRVLCEDQGTFSHQLDRIRDIAQHEGWNFAFRVDGSVRFTSLIGRTEDVRKADPASRALTDETGLMSWWCPECSEKITQPVLFFLSPCACPSCHHPLDMTGLRDVLQAVASDAAAGRVTAKNS